MGLPGQPQPASDISAVVVSGERLARLNVIINKFETLYNCTVLIWGVVGSRRWGFHSPESDYDINFVFCYPDERHWTQEGLPFKDVMFKDGEFEFHGWELSHWLTFLRKSNTFPTEFLFLNHRGPASGESYQLKSLILTDHYNVFPQWHHHAAIVRKEANKLDNRELTEPGEWIKSFLYMARSVAQCIWLQQQGTVYAKTGLQPDEPHANLAYLLWQHGRYGILPDTVSAHVQRLTLARNKGLTKDETLSEQVLNQLKMVYVENSTPPPVPTKNYFGLPVRLNQFMLRWQRDHAPRYDHRFIEGGGELIQKALEEESAC